jgi:hypothetical protein
MAHFPPPTAAVRDSVWAGEVILSLDTKDFTDSLSLASPGRATRKRVNTWTGTWQFSHRSGVADQTGVPFPAVPSAAH